ncbi:MAG: universal stress protein [Calditrichia bacterium]
MIKSILVAVDGSAFTETVLQYGIHFAEKFKAHLRVLTVIDVRIFEWAVAIGVEGFAPVIPSTIYQEESQKLLEQKADEVLKKTDRMLSQHKIDYQLDKESGNPVDVICDKARLVDMVIMGAKGEFAKWSDKMMGATVEATSRLSIKPIFVSRQKYRDIKNILLAYDGSENASKALTLAASFASTLKLSLHLLNVNSSPDEAKIMIQEAKEYLVSYNIPKIEEIIIEGDPSEKIVEAAKDKNIDLIIMGSYGHSRIREAILGSTTVQVMRHSDLPILMAR